MLKDEHLRPIALHNIRLWLWRTGIAQIYFGGKDHDIIAAPPPMPTSVEEDKEDEEEEVESQVESLEVLLAQAATVVQVDGNVAGEV